jgi:hypothetical protein
MKNAKRFVICSDIHGDEQDADAVASLHAFCDDFKPTVRVINGDLWDLRNLRKGASDDEKAHSLEDDWQAGMEFADRFFKGGKTTISCAGTTTNACGCSVSQPPA